MRSSKTSSPCVAALLALALTLLSASCGTCPPPPEPPPLLSLAWPILPPPPDGIALDPTETRVLVPLDYWTELVGYVRACEDVRAALVREGRLGP